MGSTPRNNNRAGEPIPSPTTPVPFPLRLLTQPLTVLLLLALLAAAVYSNTFSSPFHFDDIPNIAENSGIKNLFHLHNRLGSRYVGFLSFALNYHFGGLNVFGYHLVNLLIHITNGFLVYLLVRLLFRAVHSPIVNRYSLNVNRDPVSIHDSQLLAIVTALLFVAHPIQTQAVTYIVQRFTSLAAMFYLLTVVCYLKGRLSQLNTQNLKLKTLFWYAGALIATILAMKTKETTFTLPFMLLLVEAVFFAPLTRKLWIRLIPFFLTLPIIPLSRPGAMGEGEAGFASDITDISRWDYLLTQFRVIVTYLRLLIFPANQNLDYDYPVYHSLFDPPVFFSFLFLSALFVLALYLLFSSRLTPHAPRLPLLTSSALRLTAFGILWFFLTLSIESSIIPIRDVIFEHRLYLPSVGFWLAAGTVIVGLSRRRPIVGIMLAGALVTVFSVATYQRNKVWQDELTLWTDVVKKSPQKARGYSNLGLAYAEQKKSEEAIARYQTALNLKPNWATPHYNLGNVYYELGHGGEAIREYQTAIDLKPDYPKAHNNLGLAYKELGQYNRAIQEFKTALTLQPDYADPHNNLGNVYRESGQLDEAIQEYQTAVILNPDLAEAYNNLGNVHSMQRRFNEAVQEYQTAITLNPDYAEANYNLGNVLRALGRMDDAIKEYQAAITRKPDYALAHNNLGLSYYLQGRLSEAIAELEKTTQLEPNFAEAHNNLGTLYTDQARLKEAVLEFQIAKKLKPDSVHAYYGLGTAYQRLGQTHEAIQAYEQALQIKPDDEKAREALKSLTR